MMLVPASMVKKFQQSDLFAVVVLGGKEPPDHLTAAGNDTALPAVASLTVMIVNDVALVPVGMLVNAKVVFAEIVITNTVPKDKSIVVVAVVAVIKVVDSLTTFVTNVLDHDAEVPLLVKI